MPTNVNPNDLNYDHYKTEKYDGDIVNSIPGHKELHQWIDGIVENFRGKKLTILELGIGTGLTAERILKILPDAKYTAIDFSGTMLAGARKRLAPYMVDYILGDYSQIPLPQQQDLVVSVIGIHHQETDKDKKVLFRKVYDSLKEGGSFIFGDLVTYRYPATAALNEALHFHHLVGHASDEKTLKEWAYHHKFLNKLAPLEDQVEWLKEAGFKYAEVKFQRYNTALIYAKKS